MRPIEMREQIEELIERLICTLDAIDGDADFEEEPDLEQDPAEMGLADHGALYLFEVEASARRAIAEASAIEAHAASLQFIRYAAGD